MQAYVPEQDRERVRAAIERAIETKSTLQLEHRVLRDDGSTGWTLSRAIPRFDDRGEIVSWFGAASDITERKAAEEALHRTLAEREALLKELHHRVKNNLQVITSLLEMQARQTSDASALVTFAEARNRIGAIATIHELLYQSGALSEVDFALYARRLVQHVASLYDPSALTAACWRASSAAA